MKYLEKINVSVAVVFFYKFEQPAIKYIYKLTELLYTLCKNLPLLIILQLLSH